MERYKKKDMLRTVDILIRANEVVAKTITSNPQSTLDALVQCQESAIMLGTAIERLGEEYVPLVNILEDYCEIIYQMNERLFDANFCRKASKKIQKQLIGLQNRIKYDLPEDKREIVFLPYKVSMWDSMESVWQTADKDPDCDAYVIPIPYFDKNPDGSFKEEHYEGNQYPKDVPITRYDEYDLEERRPDVIYIHNPYDECNHVTSVHPYFYSKNLRNFTDKLVYIPYFVLGEIEPDDQAAIDRMKHFCFLPGTIYAHQVIVQSENMRQIYINEYIKAAKELKLSGEHVDRMFLEKKFLGTGSPKIEKVLNTRKEDIEVPEEWLKVIVKPDGSWKKIVFYNTSVSALLQNDEKMLQKMEAVFGFFKENRDEVALLWRPHPLIQATIESMRPQLWQKYIKLVRRYQEEAWGIYDDTADPSRTVVLSDAYYGDASSLVQLCQEAKLPVMIQNADVVSGLKVEKRLCIDAATVGEDKIYFSVQKGNGFFCYELLTGKLHFLGQFPEEKKNGAFLFRGAVRYGQYLILPPYYAEKLAAYDIKQGTITQYNIFSDIMYSFRISKIISYKESIYMFGNWEEPIIMWINMQTHEKGVFDRWVWKGETKTEGHQVLFERLYRNNNKVYCPVLSEPCIAVFDLETREAYVVKFRDTDSFFTAVYVDEKYIWAAECCNRVLKYAIDSDVAEKEYVDFPEEFHFSKNYPETFQGIYKHKQKLYLIPGRANHILTVDMETERIEVLHIKHDEKPDTSFGKTEVKYSWIYFRDGKLYAFHQRDAELHVIDLETGYLEKINFYDKWGIGDFLQTNRVYYEGICTQDNVYHFISYLI